MNIIKCKVNHLENPVGYRINSPVFSWKVSEAKGTKQKKARVRVSLHPDLQDCLVDTGYVQGLNSLAFQPQISLVPRTRYYWNVEVISDTEEHAVSKTQYFETGKGEEAWAGKWITCDSAVKRHPVFEKTITTSGKTLRSARLYICGLGLYEAYINGEKVGQEYLAPGCCDYDQWVQYQTYDITEQMRDGHAGGIHHLEVLMGNGWYKGRFGFDSTKTGGYYGQEWKLMAEIRFVYEDGTEDILGTDETWTVRRSQITDSTIYDGEYRDDTLPEEVECCILAEPPRGTLTERMSPPVLVQEELHPKELIITPAGEQVLDMGQNFAGIFRLRVNEERGTRIHLQFGEILQNGNFYRDNLRSAKQEYSCVVSGEETVLVPHFTFYGYCYVKIEGIRDLKKEDFTGLSLYSQMENTGSLETGNNLVNQLISNTRWGLKSNFVDVPTDCPQRDERLGWTGDAQVFSPTACYLEDCYAFYAKYLYDIGQEQKEQQGKVPQVIPSFQYKDTSSVWGDVACILPWNLYRFYGDKNILEEQFDSMKSWVDYIARIDEGSDHTAWGREFHFGDWLALDNRFGSGEQAQGGTDEDYIAYVYYMNSADIVARSAKILGYDEEAETYKTLAEELRSFIKDTYFSKNGHCCINTQTGLILALKYHLSSDENWVRGKLRMLFRNNLDRLETGFVGTPLLCPVLSENGMKDLAYRLLLNEDYPGWLYAVRLGATTIWERWNSVLPDGSISGTGMNSLNHYSYGSIVEWLFGYSAGIRQREDGVGFKKALIAPELNWQLRSMEAVYDSPAGEYHCTWRLTDETHVKLSVTVPFDCEAELLLPLAPDSVYEQKDNPMFACVEGEICRLTAGEYQVCYELTEGLRRTYSCDDTIGDILGNPSSRAILRQLIPQTDALPTMYFGRTVREILMEFKGTQGIPDAEALEMMMQQLDGILAQAE